MITFTLPCAFGTNRNSLYRPLLEELFGAQYQDWNWKLNKNDNFHTMTVEIFNDSKEESAFLFKLMISQ